MLTRKAKIDLMASEIIGRIRMLDKKKWKKIYETLNSGQWPKGQLGEQPSWWEELIHSRVATYAEIIFPTKRKIFSYEVTAPVLYFIARNHL